jgi:hypothetical protein
MFGFFAHVIFVLLCLGLGYMIRFSMEEFKELDRQIERMQQPESQHTSSYQSLPPTSGSSAHKPKLEAMVDVKLSADADKLAELKSAMKGNR